MWKPAPAALALLFAGACAPPPPVSTAPGPAAEQAPYLAQLPPLIDREIFFDDPQIAAAQISRDGRFISFRRPLDGIVNVWVMERGQRFEDARPVTDDRDRSVLSYFWSRDSRYILWAQDRGGDENFRVYAVDPAAPPAEGARVPAPRDLTPLANIRAAIISVPEDDPRHILVGLNDRDPRLHDVYRIDLQTGERTLVRRNEENVAGWVADLEGNLRLGIRQRDDGTWETLRVDGADLTPIYTCAWDETCGPVRFHRDGRRVYMITNEGERDLAELILFDLETGTWEHVDRDPDGQVDISGVEFSNATRELVATVYVGDRQRVYPKDELFARDYARVRAALPDGDIYFGSGTRDDRLRLVSVTSDVDPGATYLYDRETGEVEFLYRPRPNLPREHLAEMRPVRYTARDGVEVPAYLTVPKGVEPRNLRVVIHPHGGPWARDVWGYDPTAQFLANRGYAVFQPNFRGSTGYGKRFLNLGNLEWGTGTMQHDITDGVRWLIQQGIADPARVGIYGGSYGGYATLAGVTYTPDLYAAAVPFVAPSNLFTLIRSFPPYWQPLIRLWHMRVGNPDSPADEERLRQQSPLFAVERIRTPLLVVHGANDPRVTQHEADQIVVALRERGIDVEYLVAPDEGHGFVRRENRIALFAAMERFFAEQLGGRYQESVSPEIGQRLAVLRVAVDTVRLPEPAAAATAEAGAGAEVSFAGAAILPMTLRYQQQLEIPGRSMQATSTRTVTSSTWEGEPVWLVVDDAQTPGGAAVDSTYLMAERLLPLRRAIRQGPATIELSFAEGTVTGAIQAGPQELPINATVEGWALAEGAPLELAIGTLPLAEGYTAALQTFSFIEGRAKPQQLRVVGTERVEVPAGAFDTFKVEIAPADGSPGGSTLWVERAAPHRVVRTETRLPAQMGGGTATSELTGAEMP